MTKIGKKTQQLQKHKDIQEYKNLVQEKMGKKQQAKFDLQLITSQTCGDQVLVIDDRCCKGNMAPYLCREQLEKTETEMIVMQSWMITH